MSPVINYDITATSSSGGSITPGNTSVPAGGSATETFIANAGYHLVDVQVDGVSIGAPASYTFTNVLATHTINATFSGGDPTITASAGDGGEIIPSGSVVVGAGADQVFLINASPGYCIASVTVDGVKIGFAAGYTFKSVMTGHTIAVAFTRDIVNAICDAMVQVIKSVTSTAGYGVDWGDTWSTSAAFTVDFSAAGSLVERNPGMLDWRALPRPYACVSYVETPDNSVAASGGQYRATGDFLVRFLIKDLSGLVPDKSVGERMAATVMQDIMRGIVQDVNLLGVLNTGWLWAKDSRAGNDPDIPAICGGSITFGATWEWTR